MEAFVSVKLGQPEFCISQLVFREITYLTSLLNLSQVFAKVKEVEKASVNKLWSVGFK